MDRDELERIVTSWIKCAEAQSPDHSPEFWAHDLAMDWLRNQPESVWELVMSVYQRDPDNTVLAQLAAGPLEDLLDEHGPAFIDRVEALARKDNRFRTLLGGVWVAGMKAGVRERVERVKGPKW